MKAKIVLSVLLCLSLLFVCSASNDKIQQLDNLPADSNGVIKLNSASFELLTSGPRNYSAIVVLTALNPAFGCAACGFFEPNYQLISKSWLSTKNSQELYFGQLEVDDGRDVFMRLGIQTAPYILFYPPTEGPNAKKQDFILYEISSKGLQAEPLAEFLSQQLGVEVPINRPFDWTKNGLKLLTGVAVIIFIYFVFTKFRTILASNGIWSSISLVIILMMISGHMWNQIRGPPYVVSGPKGEVQYIVPGQMQQIGVESHIITLLYATCAVCIILLGIHVPAMKETKQRISVILLTAILLLAYSAVMYLFRIKSAGYPYRLLF